MNSPASLHPNTLWRWPGVVLLVLALLGVQVLGLAHGVRHAGSGWSKATATQTSNYQQAQAKKFAPEGVQTATVQSGAAAGLLAHLLAPPGNEGDCRLYDHLAQVGPLLQVLSVPVSLAPLSAGWAALQPRLQRLCLAFAARAPPLSR